MRLNARKRTLGTFGTLSLMSQQPDDSDDAALIMEGLHNAFYYFLQALEKLKE